MTNVGETPQWYLQNLRLRHRKPIFSYDVNAAALLEILGYLNSCAHLFNAFIKKHIILSPMFFGFDNCVSVQSISLVFVFFTLCTEIRSVEKEAMAQKWLTAPPTQKDLTVSKSDLQPEYQLAVPVYTGWPLLWAGYNASNIPLES